MNKINNRQLNILLVTSDTTLHHSTKCLIAAFKNKRGTLEWKKSGETALEAINNNVYDVCLIDENIGQSDGLSEIRRIIPAGVRKPMIFLIEEENENLRIEAMRTGAAICLVKSKIDAAQLEKAIIFAIERVGGVSELNETLSKFRNLVETLPVMIYAVKPQPPYSPIYISPAFEAFGYPLEEWNENMDFWVRLLHPEDRQSVLDEADARMKSGQETDLEYRIIAKDSTVRWVYDRGRFVSDENGKVICWQGAIIDITERKRSDDELQRREKLYLTLAQSIPNTGVLLFDRDLRYSIAEVSQIKDYRFTREMLEGKTLWEVYPSKVAEEWSKYYRRALAGETVIVETEKNGEFSEAHVVPVKNEDGGIFAGMILWQDVTERKRTENFLQISEAKLQDLFDNAPIGYHELDGEGRIVRVNHTELEMFGYTADEMLGQYVWEFVVESKSRSTVLNKLSGIESAEPHERSFRRKDGSLIAVLVKERIIKDEAGKITGIRSTVQDISERKLVEEALVNSESRYRSLGEGIKHQVWTAQPNGALNYVNERTLDYFGRTFEQIIGDGWQSMIHPDDLPECLNQWVDSLSTGEDYETEFRIRRRDGEYFWYQARATAGLAPDGKIINWFGTNTDINDRKIAEEKLNHFAGHDTLTNLPNRAKFMNYLERAINRSLYNPSLRFAVLFLDLDRFKIINDSLGHLIGDKLLIALAKRLEECLRPNDIIARLGGDEFTVLINHITDPSDAVRVAKRFLEKLSVPFILDAYEVFTSASIGIIVSDEVKRQPEDFLRDADTAMYRAKEAGKARYEIFDREMHIRNMNLLQMENDLRRAIGQNEFKVFYQPIIHLETGEIREFEALIRWQHPQHGLVPPNEFITIAEETGLIIPIGKWVLEESCRQTVEWHKRFPDYENLSISVNLSAKQLTHPNLIAQVGESLTATSLKSRFLNLEVTESMVMENGDKALAVISELNQLGIALSTDDFGTGYSSLSYLHRFPFSRLKIDRSFVSKMDSDQKSEAIVRTILLLAQNLNIEVVAEGIETEAQLISLRQLGCETGQGYFFSKPVPAEAAALLLQNGLPNVNSTSFYGFSNTDNQQLLELDKVQ